MIKFKISPKDHADMLKFFKTPEDQKYLAENYEVVDYESSKKSVAKDLPDTGEIAEEG